MEHTPEDGESEEVTDINTYLANFNKEISDGVVVDSESTSDYTIPQINGLNFIAGGNGPATLTVVQGEDGTAQLVMSSHPNISSLKVEKSDTNDGMYENNVQNNQMNNGLDGINPTIISPANSMLMNGNSESVIGNWDGNVTSSTASLVSNLLAFGQNTLSSDNQHMQATQMLSNAANVGLQSANTHLLPLNNGMISPATQLITGPTNGDTQNMLQTVTIMPSELNQNGEMSYVLILSQSDNQQVKQPVLSNGISQNCNDISIYDFSEDKVKAESVEEQVTVNKVVNVTKKQVSSTPRKNNSSGQPTQLMCDYCNYTSPKRYLLTRHMKTHSEERPHKCTICDHGFKTVASLQNHINTHTGVRPHKCKECPGAFTTSGELVRHVRYRHTFEKPHKCPDCDYCSVELSKLKRHIRSHTGERPYQCVHCSYASPDTYKLKRHLRIHTGEKPYECDICGARFTQSNSLKAHRLIHTGNKPLFQCELCPTTCGRKTDLKIHVQKLHTSDQPIQCRKCGKAFPDRYTYKIHLKTHDGEKCYKCELCPYAALSQRHLQSHILTHTGEKPFQCEHCEQSFRQKQLLKRHINLYHTPEYTPPTPREKVHDCSECNRSFAHRGNLLRHMALHDPDNPEYKNIAAPTSTEEEEERLELDAENIQYVQIMAAGDNLTAGQLGANTPVHLQLVTENGQNMILLSTDDGTQVQKIPQGNLITNVSHMDKNNLISTIDNDSLREALESQSIAQSITDSYASMQHNGKSLRHEEDMSLDDIDDDDDDDDDDDIDQESDDDEVNEIMQLEVHEEQTEEEFLMIKQEEDTDGYSLESHRKKHVDQEEASLLDISQNILQR